VQIHHVANRTGEMQKEHVYRRCHTAMCAMTGVSDEAVTAIIEEALNNADSMTKRSAASSNSLTSFSRKPNQNDDGLFATRKFSGLPCRRAGGTELGCFRSIQYSRTACDGNLRHRTAATELSNSPP
jgi:hypothetical protein